MGSCYRQIIDNMLYKQTLVDIPRVSFTQVMVQQLLSHYKRTSLLHSASVKPRFHN